MNSFIPLLVSFLAAYGAGFVGSLFTASSIDTWYPLLEKPLLNPPAYVFGPVWSILYALMAVAAYRVFLKRGSRSDARPALVLYTVHLVVNALWSIVFFGLQSVWGAFVLILALLAMLVVLTIRFYRIDQLAGFLLAPYLAWVLFAAYLNLSLAILN